MGLAPTKIDNFVALAEAWGMRALAWNPLTGCTGEDCAIGPKNCWAARRQKFFNPTYWPKRAEKILHVCKPSIIVCNFLGDALVETGWRQVQGGLSHSATRAILGELDLLTEQIGCGTAIREVIDFMRQAPQHTYFWLSKHPERYPDFDWPDGTYLGTTVNIEQDLQRLILLGGMKFRQQQIHTYVYFEPCMYHWEDKIGLTCALKDAYPDWVIIGWKSRGTLPGVEIHKESVAAVVATCEYLGIPVFCKDNLKPVFGAEFKYLPREVPGGDSSQPTADSGQPKE